MSSTNTIPQLSLCRPDPSDPAYNNTTPYLDLSPLYGTNAYEEDLVRVKDGRGMLAPDSFCEVRLLGTPPAVAALLILWNRNHNVNYFPVTVTR